MEERKDIEERKDAERVKLQIDSLSRNEEFARVMAAVFMSRMNPTLEEIDDVKTAVSEAVTNAIIHGYSDESRQVRIACDRQGGELMVTVEDDGIGIADIEQARQPFYTSKPQLERSGMGFAFMEAFTDRLEVESCPGKGTRVVLWKYIAEDCEE